MAAKRKFSEFAVPVDGRSDRFRCGLCDAQTEAGRKEYARSTLYEHHRTDHLTSTTSEEQSLYAGAGDEELADLFALALPEQPDEAAPCPALAESDGLDELFETHPNISLEQHAAEHDGEGPSEPSMEAEQTLDDLMRAMAHQAAGGIVETDVNVDGDGHGEDGEEELDGFLRALEVRPEQMFQRD